MKSAQKLLYINTSINIPETKRPPKLLAGKSINKYTRQRCTELGKSINKYTREIKRAQKITLFIILGKSINKYTRDINNAQKLLYFRN